MQVIVNSKRVSSVSGYKKENKKRLIKEFGLFDMIIKGDLNVGEFDIKTDIIKR